jgi:hypothetical protein
MKERGLLVHKECGVTQLATTPEKILINTHYINAPVGGESTIMINRKPN